MLEVLMSIALLAIIVGIGAPIYQSLQARNSLDLSADTITQSLRRAQTLARFGSGDDSWGLFIQSGTITLFKGNTYAGRVAGFDEVFELPMQITPSGLSEVVFEKFIAEPDVSGSITLTSSSGEERVIVINEKGMVDRVSEIVAVPSLYTNQTITTDWGAGYCANVDVTTDSTESLDWNISLVLDGFPLNGAPYDVWNAIWSFENQTLSASGVTTNNTITSSSPAQFGYCANRPAPPAAPALAEVLITSDWGAGYCANVNITTTSETPIVWNVDIALDSPPLNGVPYNVWNATWSFDNQIFTVSGAGWNDTVTSSSPAQFGYCANR